MENREPILRSALMLAGAVPYQYDYDSDRFLYLDEGFYSLTGYRPDEVTPDLWEEMIREFVFLGNGEGLSREEAISRAREGQLRDWEAEIRILTKDGKEKWLKDTVLLQKNSKTPVEGCIGLFRDITEEKLKIREWETLQDLSQVLAGCRSGKEIGKKMAEEARRIFEHDAFSLFYIDLEKKIIHSIYDEDTPRGEKKPRQMAPNPPRSISHIEADWEKPLLINRGKESDHSEAILFGDKRRRSRSLMYVPVFQKGKIIARLTVQSYKAKRFHERDLVYLQSLANRCGMALSRIRAEEALRQREKRFRLIIQTAEEGVWITDRKNRTIFVNKKMAQMLGYEVREMMGLIFQSFMDRDLHPEATKYLKHRRMGIREQIDIKFLRKDGSILWTIATTNPIMDDKGRHLGTLAMITDITDRKRAEEQLIHGAFHDALTDLPNRALFLDRLGVCIGRLGRRTEYRFAVLFLDLDRFKNINDSLGHIVGDQVLSEVSRRLHRCIRPGDTVARLGGDEFCILLDDIKDVNDATRVADRIQWELKSPITLKEQEVFITSSIGIALSSQEYMKPEELLRDADTAMYRAKARGRARHEVFDQEMHESAVALLKLESDMRRAVERREFKYYYQPIVSLESGRIICFEVLLRWQHPRRGLLIPEQFLSLSEETGLIVPIGLMTLKESCRQIREWKKENHRLQVSVNLSSREFIQIGLVREIENILGNTNLNGGDLNIEITESILMENAPTTINLLKELKKLEVQLYIDDFGTGYSSFSYLHRFPVDGFKIDASFVSKMEEDHVNLEIIRTITTLAHNLGLQVTAEGVETENQLASLRAIGCHNGQGMYFSAPADGETTKSLLDQKPVW